MIQDYTAASALSHLNVERRGPVSVITLDRPGKRNAINDAMVRSLERVFRQPPDGTKCIVIAAAGEHFSSGLDLSEHRHRDALDTLLNSQWWHKTFELIQFGRIPVVCAMQGGVIGGGLELAASTHVRVASETAFYALPEGQRGIYVGGGASVRVARILGPGRMVEMMLTGRIYKAEEGQALGLSHYLVREGKELDKALELAERIATNAQMSNYAIVNAIGRISDMASGEGLFTESLVAALAQTGPEVQDRINEFLNRKK